MNLEKISFEPKEDIEEIIESLSVLSTMLGYDFRVMIKNNDLNIVISKYLSVGRFMVHTEYRLIFSFKEESDKSYRLSVINLYYVPTQLSSYENLGSARVIRYKDNSFSKPIIELVDRLGRRE